VRCVEVRYLFLSAICVFGGCVMRASGFYSLGSHHISSLVLWVLSWCARGMLVGARAFSFCSHSVLVQFLFCSRYVLVLSQLGRENAQALFQYGALSVPKRGSSVRAL